MSGTEQPSGCTCLHGESAAGRPVAQILLDSALPQLDHLFDYRIPAELAGRIKVGQRVRVPFRARQRKSFGYVIAFSASSDFAGELASIAELVSEIPVLKPEIWHLARQLADRAAGSAGDILRLAIPARQVRVEKQHLAAAEASAAAPEVEDTAADVTAAAAAEGAAVDATAAEGAAVDATVAAAEAALAAAGAGEQLPAASAIAQQLLRGDRLAINASHSPVRLPSGEWVGGWAAQMAAVANAVFAAGHSVIACLPDYRDEDQLLDALAALGAPKVLRVDARQASAVRYENFLRALDQQACIIVGNRSAVYAPAHRLGAILMWDDGDPVLAEPLAPYVHARDAALLRASAGRAGLFFASHQHSIEMVRLIEMGYVAAQQNPPRRTRIVHADQAVAPEANPGRVPEFAAQTIRKGLQNGPVLVQVASAGYAPVGVCGECDEMARCANCSGPLGFKSAGVASCRWCAASAVSWRCAHCGGGQILERGSGAERTAEHFQQQFSGHRVLLSDGTHPRERVDSRPALVVATRGAEPVAAGGYAAVVLLDAQRLMGLGTLRSTEDCLRWWENAAALAAPGAICLMAAGVGKTVNAFVRGNTAALLAAELRDRANLHFPPAVRVASVIGGSAEVGAALQALAHPAPLSEVEVLGPTPLKLRAQSASAELVRAIVRFSYAAGAEVAKRLRASLVQQAAGSYSRQRGGSRGAARSTQLKLRFDDRGVFDD